MEVFRLLSQPTLCALGMHVAPPHRVPHGPIAATCPHCKKQVYYFGLAAYGLVTPPTLMLPEYPRVLAKQRLAA